MSECRVCGASLMSMPAVVLAVAGCEETACRPILLRKFSQDRLGAQFGAIRTCFEPIGLRMNYRAVVLLRQIAVTIRARDALRACQQALLTRCDNQILALAVLSRAARRPLASFTASSLAQK